MATTSVKNTARGMRGLHTTTGLVMLDVGEVREDLELSAAERKSAESTGYFEFGAKAEAEPESGPRTDPDDTTAELDKRSIAELKDIAKAEGVTLPEQGTGDGGRVLKADIVGAIAAARASSTGAGGVPADLGGGASATDELDNMSDDDLRATVQALTGEEAPADADRETLLGLARGQE